ncbi:ribosome-binding factor A [candidate division LCP-89 bacterium B3_LCP]|uniref:Ribosome-binding factor A n=1 Tax=candidate division LCP-89 bacterium B3_LCP TaxID=2012998 RepID=A0A532V3Y1_UNCL8|nr:MAG: ribosome-binding factor A [candidate division LCP-89 bacterium B3_LCP]
MSRRRWGDPLAKTPGRRQARVNDLLRRQIGNILQKKFSDDIGAMVTVTEVRTSGDLRHARTFVSIYADKPQQEAAIRKLQNIRQKLRQILAGEISLKYVPSLEFIIDESTERAQRIEDLLQRDDSEDPTE